MIINCLWGEITFRGKSEKWFCGIYLFNLAGVSGSLYRYFQICGNTRHCITFMQNNDSYDLDSYVQKVTEYKYYIEQSLNAPSVIT